jgi:hypothetical protein
MVLLVTFDMPFDSVDERIAGSVVEVTGRSRDDGSGDRFDHL